MASLHFIVTALSTLIKMRFSTLQTAAVAQLATTVLAHPHAAAEPAVGSALHKRAVNIDAYKNKLPAAAPSYVTNEFLTTGKNPSRRAVGSDNDVASALLKKQHPNAEFRVVSSYTSKKNGVTHIAFKQTAHGIDIDTADFNVNVSCDILNLALCELT